LNRRDFLQLASSVSLAASVPLLVPSALFGANDSRVIWRIGTVDNSRNEFTPGSAASILYDVSQGADARRWRQKQDATEQNYRVRFELPEPLTSPAILAIEGFFLEAGPRGLILSANGKRGWFRLMPRFARDLDLTQTLLTHTGVSLRAELDPSLFRPGDNEISILLAGPGTLFYDSLWLERTEGPARGLAAVVEPTIFYRRARRQLVEVTEVILRQSRPLTEAAVVLKVGSSTVSGKVACQPTDFGEQLVELEVPAMDAPQPYELTVATPEGEKKFQGQYRPEKRWKLFAGLKVHNDIGYTDLQPNVEELDGRNTDRVIEFAARYPFYKFNLETAWLADNYTRLRQPARVKELMKLAQQNRVGISAMFLNLLTGLCTGEEVFRSLCVARSLQRLYGVPVTIASLTDTPSQPWSLPSLLADAGISGFVLASNQHRGPLLINSLLNERSPFYWEGPDGQRMLTCFTRSYSHLDRLGAKDGKVEQMQQLIGQALTRYRRDDYAPDAMYLFGQGYDNDVLGDDEVKAMRDWNAKYEYPQFIPATDADYFEYISKHFAGKLPVFRGDAGSYWADAAGTSTAATVLNRDSQRLLPLAETLSAWASLLDAKLTYPSEALREAWREVLFYDEHTWGAHNSISQPDREFVKSQFEFKQAHAMRGHWAAKDLLTHACSRLTQHITTDSRSVLFVFNPSLHTRNDLVEAELDSNQEVVESSSGKAVRREVVSDQKGWRRVRFLAESVPGLGYKTYHVRNTKGPKATPAADDVSQVIVQDSWEIECPYYRVVLDPRTGAVMHLFDKELNRDLVDAKRPFGLNELMYVAGGKDEQIVRNVATNPATKLEISGQHSARLVENVRTPLGRRLLIQAQAKNVPLIESEISIYDHLKRIDIRNRIRKEEVQAKEAIYFAFPFGVAPPELQYQVHNAWVRPNQDQLPGACREWFTTPNLVLSRDAGITIALATPDLPLVTLADINRGRWLEHLDITNGHVYSYVTNNYWSTNIKASQGGELTFRYFITTTKNLDYDALGRFDAETRSALTAYPAFEGLHRETGPRRMPAAAGSLLHIEAANAQLTAFKAAEDGKGYILRLRETSGRDGKAILRTSPWFRIERAFLTNGVEENLSNLQSSANGLELPLKSRRFTTVRLILASPVAES
jgi:hypothetical protein